MSKITKTAINKAYIGNRKGWAFSVYWNNRPYPNLKSALYKTKKETKEQLQRFLNTGKYDFYGSAEK
jgi:hypothetical protein